jgi:hypothetical protein
MQISFVRNGTSVQVKATIRVPGHNAVTYTTAIDLRDEYYAGFVVGALQEQMGEEMRKARQEAYEAGWKEGRAKKSPKETWFSSYFGAR